jgi:hypothetical protein
MTAPAKAGEDQAEARDLRTGSDTRSANLGVRRGEDNSEETKAVTGPLFGIKE